MTEEKKCTHTRTIPGHWEDNPYYDAEEDEVGGFAGDMCDWVEGHDVGTYVDVDVHHYKCTQCGEVFRY